MKKLKQTNNLVVLLIVFILTITCSCGKQELKKDENIFTVENQVENVNDKNNTVENNNSSSNDEEKEQNKETQSNLDKNTTEIIESSQKIEVNKPILYSEDDNVIINEFSSIKNKVVNYLNSEDVESAKDKAKGVFISIVDFLFYDGEINGVKFDDLTEEGKKKVLELATDVDMFIMKKFPNYKEDISDTAKGAYNKAAELIKKGANNLKEFSKEKLGEENYNAIINAKDELVDYTKAAAEIVGNVSSKVWNAAKDKLKNWYEGFRES